MNAKDISKIDLSKLSLGDTFTTRGVMSGVSKEPLVWRLTETTDSKKEYFFNATYYGIYLGGYCITNGLAVELA